MMARGGRTADMMARGGPGVRGPQSIIACRIEEAQRSSADTEKDVSARRTRTAAPVEPVRVKAGRGGSADTEKDAGALGECAPPSRREWSRPPLHMAEPFSPNPFPAASARRFSAGLGQQLLTRTAAAAARPRSKRPRGNRPGAVAPVRVKARRGAVKGTSGAAGSRRAVPPVRVLQAQWRLGEGGTQALGREVARGDCTVGGRAARRWLGQKGARRR